MRIVFMGTPDFAVPTFSRLLADGHEILACYTRAPQPAGRGQKERKSPVHQLARKAGVPVFTPASLRDEAVQDQFRAHGAQLGVVVAYGLILPRPVLDAPDYGCLNLHGSALPRWRGAAPIQRAIMAGDEKTAVQVMAMDAGLDTGPVCASEEIVIGPQMTAGQLHDRMKEIGADLMGRTLGALERGELRFTPQSEQGVTYAAKIEKEETRIDWKQPAGLVHNLVRGLSPFPGAWSEFDIRGKPVRIKILHSEVVPASGAPGKILHEEGLVIACGQNAIRVLQVQRAGKGAMGTQEFLRGAGNLGGQMLSSD